MKQKKYIWRTFSAWEADAFRQYLEMLALEGWYPETIGGIGMKCYRGEPEKRRYAVMLVPETSTLTGADSWAAGQFRERCEKAGWKFLCSSNIWQIFYTTEEVELTEEMSDPKQFGIQKSLVFNWSSRISYPFVVILESWLVFACFQNPGELFADSWRLISLLFSIALIVFYSISYVHLLFWKHKSEQILHETGRLPVMDLRKNLARKTCWNYALLILLFVVLVLASSSSIGQLLTIIFSTLAFLGIALFVQSWLRKYGSGEKKEEWISYLVGVTALSMILIPACNALAGHLVKNEQEDNGQKQTIFASYRKEELTVNGQGTPVSVTTYESWIPWIIEKTKENYPKDMTKYWNQTQLRILTRLDSLPDEMSISWYRYTIKNEQSDAEKEAQVAVDEVILSDRSRLVVLDFGGGTDENGVEEAISHLGKIR